MKLHLTVLAVAVAAGHLKPSLCAELQQVQVHVGEDTERRTGPAAHQPMWVYKTQEGGYPPVPAADSAYPAASTPWQHPQNGAYPMPAGHPLVAPGAHPFPNGAYHPVPPPYTVVVESRENSAAAKNAESPASRERAARRALLFGLFFFLLMGVIVPAVDAVAGREFDKDNLPLMFFITIPHFLYLGGFVNLVVRLSVWVKRLIDRLETPATPEKGNTPMTTQHAMGAHYAQPYGNRQRR